MSGYIFWHIWQSYFLKKKIKISDDTTSSLIKQRNYRIGKNKEFESEKKVIADKAASKEAII